MRVRAVLDHDEPARAREPEDGPEIDRQPVQMDDQDGARERRQARGQVVGVGPEIVQADVDRDRRAARTLDRLHPRHEGVRLHQDLVAGLEARGLECQCERVGARGHPANLAHAQVGRHLALEGAHLLSTQELHALEDPIARREQLVAVRPVLAGQVQQRDAPPPRRPSCQCFHASLPVRKARAC